jgi:hypothetical protein
MLRTREKLLAMTEADDWARATRTAPSEGSVFLLFTRAAGGLRADAFGGSVGARPRTLERNGGASVRGEQPPPGLEETRM